MLALLAELRRAMRLAMMSVTHDLRVATGIADRATILRGARTVAEGATRDVFSATPCTRALLDPISGRARFDHPGLARAA